jgi:hypothetical protein
VVVRLLLQPLPLCMVRNRTSQGQPAVPPAKACLNTPRLVLLLLFCCLLRQTVESHKSRSAATKYKNVSAASGLVPTPHKCVLAVVYTGRNKHGSWRGVHLQTKVMQENQRPKRHGERRAACPLRRPLDASRLQARTAQMQATPAMGLMMQRDNVLEKNESTT